MSVFISSLSFLQVSSTLENFVHPLSEGEGITTRREAEIKAAAMMEPSGGVDYLLFINYFH